MNTSSITFHHLNLTEPTALLELSRCWERAVPTHYQIANRAWKQSLAQSVVLQDDDVIVARSPGGFIVGLIVIRGPLFNNYREMYNAYPHDVGWIVAFCVDRNHSRQGIERQLLELAIRQLEKRGATSVSFSGGPDRLLPGLIADYSCKSISTLAASYGFQVQNTTWDMVAVYPYSMVLSITHSKTSVSGLRFKKGIDTGPQLDSLRTLMTSNGWGRWLNQLEIAVSHDVNIFRQCFVCMADDDDKVVGFVTARYQTDGYLAPSLFFHNDVEINVGGIGPVGVSEDFRNRGIGRQLIFRSVAHLNSMGCKVIVADSTAVPQFYEGLGFQRKRSFLRTHELAL